MAQKLWEKSVQVNKEIDRFTVGRDREMDLYLAKHDVMGSMAHITMLQSIGLLTEEELSLLLAELKNIYAEAERGEFVIEDGVEDVHSQVELMLTRRLGDVGKKMGHFQGDCSLGEKWIKQYGLFFAEYEIGRASCRERV